MSDFKFEIIQNLAVLSEGTKGWQKELNKVSWNERSPKLDIRDWGPNHEKMGKGISLNNEEIMKLKEFLTAWDGDVN